MFGQDAVLPIELKNLTWNTAHWKDVNDTTSLLAARARQWERQREDIDAAVHRLKESQDANKLCFDQAARLKAEELQVNNLVLLHETETKQSQGFKLDAKWSELY
jgi:hypothetical protein